MSSPTNRITFTDSRAGQSRPGHYGRSKLPLLGARSRRGEPNRWLIRRGIAGLGRPTLGVPFMRGSGILEPLTTVKHRCRTICRQGAGGAHFIRPDLSASCLAVLPRAPIVQRSAVLVPAGGLEIRGQPARSSPICNPLFSTTPPGPPARRAWVMAMAMRRSSRRSYGPNPTTNM